VPAEENSTNQEPPTTSAESSDEAHGQSKDTEIDNDAEREKLPVQKRSTFRRKIVVMDSSDDEEEETLVVNDDLLPKPKPLILEEKDVEEDQEELPPLEVAVEEHQSSLKAKEPLVNLDMTDAEAAQTVHDIIKDTSKLLFDDDDQL
jgi:hypothetical protein